MKMQLWMALALLAACGTKTAADATTTTDVAADVALADDAVEDATGPTTTVYDAGADTAVKLSPAAKQCSQIAAQICGAAKSCCKAGVGADCEANETEACMKLGFAGIDDASVVGVVKLDAGRAKACQVTLDAAGQSCDYIGMQAARRQCLLAWLDSASKGDQCTATAPVACDSFTGRCDPVTTDSYACRKAGADGDACNLGKPCSVELDCLNTQVTRATVCGKPNSTCEISDACAQGFKCSSGFACEPWADGGKDGATCKADLDCAVGLKCDGAKCGQSLCGL